MPIPMICLVSGYRKMIVEEIMKILSFPEPEILRVKIGSTVSCLDIFERVSNILEIFLPVRHVFNLDIVHYIGFVFGCICIKTDLFSG